MNMPKGVLWLFTFYRETPQRELVIFWRVLLIKMGSYMQKVKDAIPYTCSPCVVSCCTLSLSDKALAGREIDEVNVVQRSTIERLAGDGEVLDTLNSRQVV
jgi:hypothetical protein